MPGFCLFIDGVDEYDGNYWAFLGIGFVSHDF
jgi:hypothetical protein